MSEYIREIKPSEVADCPQCNAHALVTYDPVENNDPENKDGTTHVCHPALGGCNVGFKVPEPVTSLVVKRGQKQFSFRKDGTFSGADGPDGVKLMRLLYQLNGLEMEIRSNGKMKMTAGPHVSFRLKKEFGYTGNRHKVYRQFCEAHGLQMKMEILLMDPKAPRAKSR